MMSPARTCRSGSLLRWWRGDTGATVTGIDEANLRQYLLELMHACVGGELQPDKFAVGLRACGVPTDDKTPVLLTELLWCGMQHHCTASGCVSTMSCPQHVAAAPSEESLI